MPPSATRPPNPSPVPVQDRIEALDVMRGFALLGIFIMNMPGFGSSFFMPEAAAAQMMEDAQPWDGFVLSLNAALLEGKFNGLFTFLFGMGLALQMGRLGPDGLHVIRRRLLVLFAFGALHIALLWGGDVLHIYAVLGMALWALRNAPPRTLLHIALALLLAQFAHGMVMASLWSLDFYAAEQEFLAGLMERDDLVLGEGAWWQGVPVRLHAWWLFYTSAFLVGPSSWFWLSLLTTAVLGLWAARVGWLTPSSPLRTGLRSPQGLKVAVGLCLAGLLMWALSATLMAGHDTQVAPTPAVMLGWALGDTARVLQVLGYAALILRWCDGTASAGLRRHLATVGRMPLSQYLLQSLMGTFIFNGWGLGLWSELGTGAQTALAIGLFALVQVPLAHWWLGRNPIGPAEALWRRLSYGPRAA